MERLSGSARTHAAARRAALGAVLLAVAGAGLWADVGWIAQPFYLWVWWGTILLVDALCVARRGASLTTTRRRWLLPLCAASITFWFGFEFLNLHFQNWYYVGTFRIDTPLRLSLTGLYVAGAFATVFVGIFELYDALGALGWWHRRRKPRSLARLGWILQCVGLLMAACAIAFPVYCAPLIWGSLSLLLDPWNARRGARSVLADFESGNFGAPYRLLAAGLLCGLIWESANFVAPQKWIYTVRGLEHWKLFEMPLLGFLGFPALALDSLAAWSALSFACFGNAAIEDPQDLVASPSPRASRQRWFWWSTPLQALLCVLVARGIIAVNVGSVQLELDQLALSRSEIDALSSGGVRRPRQLERRLRHEPESLPDSLNWTPVRRATLLQQIELFTHKGIGGYHGAQLERAGVHNIGDLGRHDVASLSLALEAVARGSDVRLPRNDMIRAWVLAARDRGVVLRVR